MITVEWNLTRPKLRLTKRSELSMLYHPSTRASNMCGRRAMTTAAAIDRLVHHCVILELNIPSYRIEQAKKAKAEASTE